MRLVPEARIREYTEKGWWGDKTLWDYFVERCAEHPQRQALVDAPNRGDFMHGEPQSLTWEQAAQAVDRYCRALLDAGLRQDDIVIVQMPNCVELSLIYLACLRLGIVVSPVPIQYRNHELEQIAAIAGARAAITCTRIGRGTHPHAAAELFLQLAARPDSTLEIVLALGDAVPQDAVGLDAATATPCTEADLKRVRAAETAAAVSANDVFTVCWTSGTEAFPKGVPRSHNEWLIIGPSIIESAELQPGLRLLNPFPMINMGGISTAFVTWLLLGTTLIQHQPFNLEVFLRQLRDERVDYTVAPPAILNMLLQNDHLLEGIDFSRLRRIGSGSAPLSEWMVSTFAERYGVDIVNYFGSNEGAALSSSHRDIPDPVMRSQYFVRAGVEGYTWSTSTSRKIRTRLVDPETGDDIAEPGRPGELRVSGPTIFSAYLNAPEATARAFDELGYYRSGDLFEIAGDRKQYYRYVGRAKDVVIRGGMNISSEEVENLLLSCPGIREAAVVGVPDETLGEKVCACVVFKEDARPGLNAIKTFLQREKQVAVYKLPEYLLQFDELPRNPVGKLLKRELRLAVSERLSDSTSHHA